MPLWWFGGICQLQSNATSIFLTVLCCAVCLLLVLQLAAQVRKVEQQEKKLKSLMEQVNGLKDQIQSLNAARQKAQDSFTQQLQVRQRFDLNGHWPPWYHGQLLVNEAHGGLLDANRAWCLSNAVCAAP